jgi:NAD(P)-binding Rossmann-like domain
MHEIFTRNVVSHRHQHSAKVVVAWLKLRNRMMSKSCMQQKDKQRWFSEIARAMLAILAMGLLSHEVKGFSQQRADVVDICIIGAGPSGIQAAYTAEAKGYTVAVFEKEDYVGGKTKSIEVENAPRPYFVGAILHVGGKSSSLKELFKKFQVSKLEIDYEVTYINPDGSKAKFSPPLVQFIVQFIKVLFIRASLAHNINGPEGYLSDYPTSLNEPLQDWLKQNSVLAMMDFYWLFMTTFGCGSLKEVPAIYAFKYGPATLMVNALLFLLEQQKSTVDFYPFQELLQKMTTTLSGDIYLNCEITSVKYQGISGTEIIFSVNGTPSSSIVSCSSTIIAFPPTREAMEHFLPPDSSELEDLVEQVQTSNCYTILFDDTEGYFGDGSMMTFVLPQTDVPTNPGVNLFYFKEQDFKGSSVAAVYLAPLGSTITDEQVLEESLASYSSAIGRPVDGSIVQDLNKWIYFPHASTESLQDGFYEKFQSLQGYHNQYYTGGLFNFESVQDSMEHAEYIIKTFFSGVSYSRPWTTQQSICEYSL